MQKQIFLTIMGRVQGVFFRVETQKEALRLQLKGYVKNNPDGSVTVLAQGEEDKLQQLIEWCKKGPDGALVNDVQIQDKPPEKETFDGFEVQ